MARWLRAIEAGAIFARVRPSPDGWPSRRKAERVAQSVLAVAPAEAGIDVRIFTGAALLACG